MTRVSSSQISAKHKNMQVEPITYSSGRTQTIPIYEYRCANTIANHSLRLKGNYLVWESGAIPPN